ncbi:MAG: type II toxin-antitoxin system HicA family toxin [Chloroflexi bacterium]|nr:type II toxin-antitoxin system HicA family toxin [Chloroflexota bacterium]
MTYSELTRKLKKLGCEFRRQAKGDHEIWWRPERKLYTSIPHHTNKEIATGTLNAILRDLGITMKDLAGK